LNFAVYDSLLDFWHPSSIITVRPVFTYFTPLGPRKFCASPPLFVHIQLCSVKFPSTVNQHRNEKTRYQHCFRYRSPLNFSLVDSLFFSAYHTSISIFLICRPWKFAALGPGPCVNMGLITVHDKLE
jgi:hypothetical protein